MSTKCTWYTADIQSNVRLLFKKKDIFDKYLGKQEPHDIQE